MKHILVDEDEGLINVFDSSDELLDHFDNWDPEGGYSEGSLPLDCFYYFEVEDDFSLGFEDIHQECTIFGAIFAKGFDSKNELIKDHPIFYKEE